MTLMQIAHGERHAAIQIDQHEIGIHSGLQRSLAADAKATGGLRRQEGADALEWQRAPVMTRFEEHGQGGLHSANAAPRRDEIAALHRGWRRRVVGGDDVHSSVRELVPELVLIARAAQWRSTLGDRAQPLDILLGEEEIVRTRFY